MKRKMTPFSEKRLTNAQDGILERYKERYGLTDKEADDLHSFFSPCRVPTELTRKEIRLIIMVYPLLSSYQQRAVSTLEKFLFGKQRVPVSVAPTPLPEEFEYGGRMTRRKFKSGMRKLWRMIT
jgi:hypothetical protein